jgi:hypothetical protein
MPDAHAPHVPWSARWTDVPEGAAAAASERDAPRHDGPALPWPANRSQHSAAPAVPSSAVGHGAEASATGDPTPAALAEASPAKPVQGEASSTPNDGEGRTAADVPFEKFMHVLSPFSGRLRQDLGASDELVTQAGSFLHDFACGAVDLNTVKRQHSYHFRASDVGLEGQDAAIATAWLNHASRNGIAEEEAVRLVPWWLDQPAGGIAALLKAKPTPAAPAQSRDDEIAKIETMLRTDRKAYNRSPAIQQRFRELLGARDAATR